MYFIKAYWYMMSAIGCASFALFAFLLIGIFNEEAINRSIGYRNYFILIAAYALGALPLAATINGGTGDNFMFHLGCICPSLWYLSTLLEKEYLARQSRLPASQPHIPAAAPQPADAPQQAFHANAAGPAYAPAPASLADDFDVPMQR